MAGVKSWSRTAGSNTLANTGFTMDEGMAPSAVNDSVRQLMADVATEWFKGNDVASATTPDITGTATTSGGYIHITGTTQIEGFATATAGIERTLVFDDALVLLYHATTFILPGLASITTVAKDTAVFRSEGSGNWRCISYTRSTGKAVNPAQFKIGTFTRDLTAVTGTVNITGLGFTPTAVFIMGGLSASTEIGFGMDNGTTRINVYNNSAVSATTWGVVTTAVISVVESGSNYQIATISALASGQFTVSWTKTGTPTGTATFGYLALGY